MKLIKKKSIKLKKVIYLFNELKKYIRGYLFLMSDCSICNIFDFFVSKYIIVESC